MKLKLGFLMMSLCLCVFLCGTLGVNAQEEDDDNEFILVDVVVTAEKREQNLQKVATTVESISGYELTEMGLVDLDEALRNVSSALVQPVGEEMTVIIRGMDNDAMPGDSFSQVAVTVDGSFSNNWAVGTTGLYDMERIEVLSGPQGTLYSRNSSGGVINMISNDPNPEKFEASGSLELGNYRLVNTQGMVNAPINDDWAVRAAFASTVREGYADNGLSDADDRSVRLKLAYKPSDKLSAVLTYEYQKIGGKSQGDGFAAFEDQDDVPNPWHSDSDGDLFVSNTQNNRFYMNLVLDTPIGELTFLPSYLDTSRHNIQAGWVWSDGSFGPMAPPAPPGMPPTEKVLQAGEHFESPQKEYSGELRLTSHADSFMDWMVGFYYYERTWDDHIFHKDVYGPGGIFIPSTEFTAPWGQRNNPSRAAFANATYPVTDRFRVTVGGRYTEDEENLKGTDRRTGEPYSRHYESDHFDYKFSMEYDVSDDSMIWVDHSTGYKHAAQGRASQELMSYQIGTKNRFMDDRLQMNATAFYYDYTNFDIGRMGGVPGPDPSEVEPTVTYNPQGIGDATLYGLDVSTDYIITEADRINVSLSYLSADVDEVIVTYSYGGVEYPDLMPSISIDAGKPLNNAPELSIVGSYEHRFDLAGGGELTPRISARYTSEYYLEFYPDPQNAPGMDIDKVNTEPSKVMGDVSLNYRHSSGNWSLNAYVKNITNHAEKNGLMRADMRLGPPRTYGAVLSVRH